MSDSEYRSEGRTEARTRATAARRAVTDSCIPLLCGDPRRAYRAAGRLLHRYGLTSYHLPQKNARRAGLLTRLLAAPTVRTLPPVPSDPGLLADAAIAFFSVLPPTAIPVLIDCTDGARLVGDPLLRERLEPHCFLLPADALRETPPTAPPFSYLHTPEPHPKGGIRR